MKPRRTRSRPDTAWIRALSEFPTPAEATATHKTLTAEARDAAGKADAIQNASYDLKAVNPNRKAVVDTRTPNELMDLIEAKGQEVAAALNRLRSLCRSS